MARVVKLGARTSIERQARKWLVRMNGDEPLTEAEKETSIRTARRSHILLAVAGTI